MDVRVSPNWELSIPASACFAHHDNAYCNWQHSVTVCQYQVQVPLAAVSIESTAIYQLLFRNAMISNNKTSSKMSIGALSNQQQQFCTIWSNVLQALKPLSWFSGSHYWVYYGSPSLVTIFTQASYLSVLVISQKPVVFLHECSHWMEYFNWILLCKRNSFSRFWGWWQGDCGKRRPWNCGSWAAWAKRQAAQMARKLNQISTDIQRRWPGIWSHLS